MNDDKLDGKVLFRNMFIAVGFICLFFAGEQAFASQPTNEIPQTQTLWSASLPNQLAFIINTNKLTSNFIVVDKVRGQLHIVEPTGNILASTKVLVGRDRSDFLDRAAYNGEKPFTRKITPAGIFQIKKYIAQKYGGDILTFIDGPKAATAIHRVYLGNPAQRRAERIQSDNPQERRITDGCINVPTDFFNEHLTNIPNGTLIFVLPEQAKTPEEFINYLTVAQQ